MATTESTTVNPRTRDRLRAEYGPAPWWSEPHLRALVEDEGLHYTQIADVWNVHPDTVSEWAREYGIGGRSA